MLSLAGYVLLYNPCTLLHVSVSVKDSLDSQLEEAKLFTVKRTYVILNWVDRRTAFTRQSHCLHTNIYSSTPQLARCTWKPRTTPKLGDIYYPSNSTLIYSAAHSKITRQRKNPTSQLPRLIWILSCARYHGSVA